MNESNSPEKPDSSVVWRRVGNGQRLHAFATRNTDTALCGIGGELGKPIPPSLWTKCKVCEARTERRQRE